MTDTGASASAPAPAPIPPSDAKMINFEEMPELLKYLPESLKDEIPDDLLDRLHLTREELKVTDDEPMDVALLCTLEGIYSPPDLNFLFVNQ